MTNKPKMRFQDKEEEALHRATETDGFTPGESALTAERKSALQEAARSTSNEERAKISLRIPKSDLARLKAQALREGIPYQTLINSILHRAVQR